MARRRKSSSGGILGAVVVGVVALVASVPKEVWVFFGLLMVVAVAIYTYNRSKKTRQSVASEVAVPVRRASVIPQKSVPDAVASSSKSRASRFVEDDVPVSVASIVPAPSTAASFRVPPAPKDLDTSIPVRDRAPPPAVSSGFRVPATLKGFGAATWIPAGQSVEVAGTTVYGGMVYLGTSLTTPGGTNDPCLIDPSKSVAADGDYTERQMGYWPSYSEISATARRAYLNWLAGGRKDPDADVGYVFIFFYGLERRAILDAAKNDAVKGDWSAIAEELRRLLRIYGEKSGSFRSYASSLLDWVSVAEHPEKAYLKPTPSFTKTYELPLYIRVALGQAAVDKAPVPAELALAWAKLDPSSYLRTPATRCGEEFSRLFVRKYQEAFGQGMVLPRNRTKLKLVHRPASAGFRGYKDLSLEFGDTPDVSVLTAPITKLREVVEAATKELEPFSRFVGKNPDARHALEGLLQLPATMWPESAQKVLQDLKVRMGGGMVVMSFQDLLSSLDAKSKLTKEKTLVLARALESMNIGIEPDLLGGAKLPKPDEKLVLFSVPPGEATSRASASYQAAALTLQLASAVASADGDFSVKEMSYLREQVQSWTYLTPNHIRRLLAHLRLLVTAPVSLAALKKKLEPLDATAKDSIAKFMATVAQSDGEVTPSEVKMLEKVYKALGVEPKKVFSDVHAVASGAKPTVASTAKVEENGFRLDPERIAALQKDTATVSALLANIFKDEEAAAPTVLEPEVELEAPKPAKGIMGLDEAHTAMVRLMLSRPEWGREDLIDVAADLELMLDGALEHINEAAFDTYDMALFEGDDPVTVNAEILEKVEA